MLKLLTHFMHSMYKVPSMFLFPSCCAFCKSILDERAIFCIHCQNMIRPVVSTSIPIGKQYSLTIHAIAEYREPLRPLILAKGWSDIIAAYQLGELMWQHTNFKNIPADYLIPVPLHWTRFAWRGYNQAEEMAKVLGAKRNIPVATIVRRVKKTRFQSSLSAEDRQRNVAEAFVLTDNDENLYRGKHLVLVDDLYTTGATIRETAKALTALKPASMAAVVPCRVSRH